MVNQTLGNILCHLCGDKQLNWEVTLPQVEFTCNNKLNQSTSKAPFEILYTCPHAMSVTSIPLAERAGESKTTNNVAESALRIHAKVWIHLETAYAKYKAEVDKHHHKKLFVEVTRWWHIYAKVISLAFTLNWRSANADHFEWHGRLIIMLMGFSCQIARASLTPLMWLICSSIIQMMRNCTSQSWG